MCRGSWPGKNRNISWPAVFHLTSVLRGMGGLLPKNGADRKSTGNHAGHPDAERV